MTKTKIKNDKVENGVGELQKTELENPKAENESDYEIIREALSAQIAKTYFAIRDSERMYENLRKNNPSVYNKLPEHIHSFFKKDWL